MTLSYCQNFVPTIYLALEITVHVKPGPTMCFMRGRIWGGVGRGRRGLSNKHCLLTFIYIIILIIIMALLLLLLLWLLLLSFLLLLLL